MTYDEWLEKYLRRFRKEWKEPLDRLEIEDDMKLYFDEKKGFMWYAIRGDRFHIDHTSTNDIAYMHEQARTMAKQAGCRILETEVARNAPAYVRLAHTHLNVVKSEVKADGHFYWLMEDEV